MSEKKDNGKKEVDSELDDLLDSALQEMTNKPADQQPGSTPNPGEIPPNMWSEEFIKEAAAQFESNMAALLGGFSGVPEGDITQDQIAETFTKMAEAAAHVLQAPPAEGVTETTPPPVADDPEVKQKIDDVTAAISETLKNLNTDSGNLQTPFTEQDLANMFNNFSMGATDGQENNMFIPFMQGMMQSLLSKEVLYPSLKELIDKYPGWLTENKDKIEKSDFERYEKQHELMKQVCDELEPEQESDPEDVKRKRFETVFNLMQKMQDLGQPPSELVGDIGTPPAGFAAPPGADASQCNVM